jgi:hypothetical protein
MLKWNVALNLFLDSSMKPSKPSKPCRALICDIICVCTYVGRQLFNSAEEKRSGRTLVAVAGSCGNRVTGFGNVLLVHRATVYFWQFFWKWQNYLKFMANFFPLVKLCVDLGQKKKKNGLGRILDDFFSLKLVWSPCSSQRQKPASAAAATASFNTLNNNSAPTPLRMAQPTHMTWDEWRQAHLKTSRQQRLRGPRSTKITSFVLYTSNIWHSFHSNTHTVIMHIT